MKYMIVAIENARTPRYRALDIRLSDTREVEYSRKIITSMINRMRKYRPDYKDLTPKQIQSQVVFNLYEIDTVDANGSLRGHNYSWQYAWGRTTGPCHWEWDNY